jgi:hypothetical protein
MANGPYSRIVIKRANGRTEIIGRAGHLDPNRMVRELAPFGDVLAVRHEQAEGNGPPTTVAIHTIRLTPAQIKQRAKGNG